MEEKLGILAGGGPLPRLIIAEAHKKGQKAIVCGFLGHTDKETLDMADMKGEFYIGQFGKVIKFFHSHGVKNICLAGTINKPKVLDLRPDFIAAKMIFALQSKGDDSILRAVIKQLEKEGLTVLPLSYLVPSLLCPAGLLSNRTPTKEIQEALEYILPVINSLGVFDIGQSVVVKENMVIAIEAIEGTDATIKRAAALGKTECMLFKFSKLNQDERADLPTIGLETIKNLVEGKYLALVVEADKTLFFDIDESIALANKHNLVIWAVERK